MDAGENVIYAVLPGPDYAGALLFFFENGKAARVDLKAYQTTSNRRKLTGAYSDKAPLALYPPDGHRTAELAVYSTEPRALIFHTALLAPKTTRTTQGVAVMTLKPKVPSGDGEGAGGNAHHQPEPLPGAAVSRRRAPCCGRRTPRSGRSDLLD